MFHYFCHNHHEDAISKPEAPHSILRQPRLRQDMESDDDALSDELIAEIRERSILKLYLGEYFRHSKYIVQDDEQLMKTKIRAMKYITLCRRHQRTYHEYCSRDILEKSRKLVGLDQPGSYGSRTGFKAVKV